MNCEIRDDDGLRCNHPVRHHMYGGYYSGSGVMCCSKHATELLLHGWTEEYPEPPCSGVEDDDHALTSTTEGGAADERLPASGSYDPPHS